MSTKVFNRTYLYEIMSKKSISDSKSTTYNKIFKVMELAGALTKFVVKQPLHLQKNVRNSVFKKWVDPSVWNKMTQKEQNRHRLRVQHYNSSLKIRKHIILPKNNKHFINKYGTPAPYLFNNIHKRIKSQNVILPSFWFYKHRKTSLNWQKVILRFIQIYRPNWGVLWYKVPCGYNSASALKRYFLKKFIRFSPNISNYYSILGYKNLLPRYAGLTKIFVNKRRSLRLSFPVRDKLLLHYNPSHLVVKMLWSACRKLLVCDARDRARKLFEVWRELVKSIVFNNIPLVSPGELKMLALYNMAFSFRTILASILFQKAAQGLRGAILSRKMNRLINSLRKVIELKINPSSISFPKRAWAKLPDALKKKIKIKNNLVKRYWAWKSSGLLSCRTSRWLNPAIWKCTTRLQKNAFKKWSYLIFTTKKTGVHVSAQKSRAIYMEVVKELLKEKSEKVSKKLPAVEYNSSKNIFVPLIFKKKQWSALYSWQRQSNRLLWWAMNRSPLLHPSSKTDKKLGNNTSVYPKRSLSPAAPVVKLKAPLSWKEQLAPLLDRMKKGFSNNKPAFKTDKKLGNNTSVYPKRSLSPAALVSKLNTSGRQKPKTEVARKSKVHYPSRKTHRNET